MQRVIGGRLDAETERYRVRNGQGFVIVPGVSHVFQVETDAEWLDLLCSRVNSASPDFPARKVDARVGFPLQ